MQILVFTTSNLTNDNNPLHLIIDVGLLYLNNLIYFSSLSADGTMEGLLQPARPYIWIWVIKEK